MDPVLYAKAYRVGGAAARCLVAVVLGACGLIARRWGSPDVATFFMCCAACALWSRD